MLATQSQLATGDPQKGKLVGAEPMLGGNRWRCAASELLFVLLRKQVELECLFKGRERGEAADLERDRVPDGCVLSSKVFCGVWDVLMFSGCVSGGVVVDS